MTISYCRHHHCEPDPNAQALEIVGLVAGYPGQEAPALVNVNVHITKGASIALVGPNGAGKSTLFKAISGLIPLRAGSIYVFGHHLRECHQRVVYLPQRSDIDWQFPISVEELALTGRYVYLGWLSRPGKEDLSLVRQALERLNILDLAHRQISELSGGQQQRVLIARALTQNADLLLLDEPLNAIDTQTRSLVAEVLSELKSKGKTVIIATHYYNEEEKLYDGAIYLRDGQQIEMGATGSDQGRCC